MRLLGLLYIGLIPGGFGLHFWTVRIVHHVEGRGPAIVAFMFPVGPEIYWAFKEWRAFGFANLYTLAVIGYGALWPLMAWAFVTLERTDEKQD